MSICYNGGMDFEERERQRRRQMIGTIIAEVGMFFAVVAIVVVATLAAMGFFVSSDGTIEQSGLIQIHSLPTGSTVELDGSTLFSRTNLSRSLTAGEHKIKISRDNYDSWQKNVKMYSGMLIRLYYPRLFLNNRTQETMQHLGKDLDFFVPSKDYAYILYAEANSTKWQLLNIKGDEVRTSVLDMSTVLPGVKDQVFSGRVVDLKWSENSDRALIKTEAEGKKEWILVDLRDVSRSLNLTKTFGLEFAQVEMIDDSAAQLFVLENNQLRRINIADQSISRVLLNDVESFAAEGTNIIYVANGIGENDEKNKIVGVYRDGERNGTTIARLKADDRVRVALTKYFDEDYMAFAVNDRMTVYYGTLPSYRENVADTDFLNFKVLLDEVEIGLMPSEISVSEEGEYLAMHDGKNFSVVDLDMGDLYKYESSIDRVNWLNESMLFATVDGKLEVWDFDNTNHRTLVALQEQKAQEDGATEGQDGQNIQDELRFAAVTTLSKYPVANYSVVVANNNRWLYYLVKKDSGYTLVREKVRE